MQILKCQKQKYIVEQIENKKKTFILHVDRINAKGW